MKIHFCGAATDVTGSCHLITTDTCKILLDCGQFQGSEEEEKKNFEPFPFNPKELDAVVLSHAHIDHCGRLPLLIRQGFRGKIYCTTATRDLTEIMLLDSGSIHESDAERANRKNERAGLPLVKPLFTVKEAEATIPYLTPVVYDQLIHVTNTVDVCFNDAGHILGSAIVELFITEGEKRSKLVFSGDIGMNDRPLLKDPKIIKKADYLIMETTYGNRNHPEDGERMEELIGIMRKTIARGGKVIIPSFAVGRTQELIYELNKYYDSENPLYAFLRKVPVYVDSPMAGEATKVFFRNAEIYDADAREKLLKGDNPLDFRNLHFVKTAEQSKKLNNDPTPKIIIAASGMCEAGRIKHHLKYNLWNAKNAVVFVGYQAKGTLGYYITHGAKDVNILGERIHVASEIYSLGGFSGHAGQEQLFAWLSGFQKTPSRIFLVHGESEAKRDFAALVQNKKGWHTTPVYSVREVDLSVAEPETPAETPERILEPEEYSKVCGKVGQVTQSLVSVLRETALVLGMDPATGEILSKPGEIQLSAERVHEINNALLELERETLNLGSLVTMEDRPKEETEGDTNSVSAKKN